jgi:hypothetical protein
MSNTYSHPVMLYEDDMIASFSAISIIVEAKDCSIETIGEKIYIPQSFRNRINIDVALLYIYINNVPSSTFSALLPLSRALFLALPCIIITITLQSIFLIYSNYSAVKNTCTDRWS